MHSKPLRQSLQLTLDTMAMRGPFKIRDVAKEWKRNTPEEHWALADIDDAQINYGMLAAKALMTERLSDESIDRHLTGIPDELRPMIQKLSKYTCISGGKGPLWALTFLVTPQQLDDNYKMKHEVAEATLISADNVADLRDFLIANNATCFMDYLEKRKAE